MLVTTWLLLGVVLTSVYSSQLTSSLTVSNEALPFTSLAQLLKQDTYTWGVPKGTAQESVLKVGTEDFNGCCIYLIVILCHQNVIVAVPFPLSSSYESNSTGIGISISGYSSKVVLVVVVKTVVVVVDVVVVVLSSLQQ